MLHNLRTIVFNSHAHSIATSNPNPATAKPVSIDPAMAILAPAVLVDVVTPVALLEPVVFVPSLVTLADSEVDEEADEVLTIVAGMLLPLTLGNAVKVVQLALGHVPVLLRTLSNGPLKTTTSQSLLSRTSFAANFIKQPSSDSKPLELQTPTNPHIHHKTMKKKRISEALFTHVGPVSQVQLIFALSRLFCLGSLSRYCSSPHRPRK
jgi:hypothetical protein